MSFGFLQVGSRVASSCILAQGISAVSRCKSHLTLRDSESWYDSACTTTFEALEIGRHSPNADKTKNAQMKRRLVLDHTFTGKHWEKSHTINVHEQHIRDVIELVPDEQLLKFHVAEGWKPLCDFLGVAKPDEPFPKLNDRHSFLSTTPEWAKQIKVTRWKSDNR